MTTVVEQDEEDPVTQKLAHMALTEEEEEADGSVDIPVIVETYEVDEHQDPSPDQVAPEPVEPPIQTETTTQEVSTTGSPSSSWDSISSEIAEIVEVPGPVANVEPVVEPKTVETPATEEESVGKEVPEANEEPKEGTPEEVEQASEDEKVKDTSLR